MKKFIGFAVLTAVVSGSGYFILKQKSGKNPIWVHEGLPTADGKSVKGDDSGRSENRKTASVENSNNEAGYPIHTSEKSFPKTGEAWVYKMERPAKKTDATSESKRPVSPDENSDENEVTTADVGSNETPEKEKFFSKDLKGETTVYQPKDEKNVAYVKVTLKKGLPEGVENTDLPGFKIETDDHKQVKKVSIIGELSNPKMQKAWEKVGREVITSVLKSSPAHSALKTEKISVREEDHDLDLSQDIKVLSWSEYIKVEDQEIKKEPNRAPASVQAVAPQLADFSKWDAKERAKSLDRLVKKIDQDGIDAAKDVEKFLKTRADSKSWVFGTSVLAGSRNPDAQKVLFQVLNSGGTNSAQKQQVLTAFSSTPQHLSKEGEETLMKLIKNSKGEAKKNAMGAFGAAIRGSQDEAQRIQFETEIIGMSKNAKTTDEELALLEAIGQSGSPAFIPILKQKIKSSNEDVRLKAAYATRFMTDDDSDDVLDDAEDDASLKVKKMAASVRAFQKKREKNPTFASFSAEE